MRCLSHNPVSLYIHIPFCKSKCFYCSFASFDKKDYLIEPYLEALEKEARRYRRTPIETVYIGGGTPTYLALAQIKDLFANIRSNFILSLNAEITVEANPATFDLAKAKGLYALGINRISLGIQSLNDKNLKYLGRLHDRRKALASFEILRQAGFKNVNLDLIYSLPGQSAKDIKEDVQAIAGLGSEHISLYAFTVSEGSEFFRKKIEPPTAERQGEHYQMVVDSIEKSGFQHYEVSNFVKEGYACRHNLNYWQGGNYIGLGTSAHSHQDGHRYWNVLDLQAYIQMMRDTDSAKIGEEKLSAPQRFMETLLIGLRLTDGLDVKSLESRFGVKLPEEKAQKIDDFIRHGLLLKDRGWLKTTSSGMLVLDEISSQLI